MIASNPFGVLGLLLVLAAVVAVSYGVLLVAGRHVDPFRRWKNTRERVDGKVADNDRVTLENRVRRHSDFVGLGRDYGIVVEDAPVFMHPYVEAGWAQPHLFSSSDCPYCAVILRELTGDLRSFREASRA